jgi:hypothetical protein
LVSTKLQQAATQKNDINHEKTRLSCCEILG